MDVRRRSLSTQEPSSLFGVGRGALASQPRQRCVRADPVCVVTLILSSNLLHPHGVTLPRRFRCPLDVTRTLSPLVGRKRSRSVSFTAKVGAFARHDEPHLTRVSIIDAPELDRRSRVMRTRI
jgi:hypothetical protein